MTSTPRGTGDRLSGDVPGALSLRRFVPFTATGLRDWGLAGGRDADRFDLLLDICDLLGARPVSPMPADVKDVSPGKVQSA